MMNNRQKYLILAASLLLIFSSCKKKDQDAISIDKVFADSVMLVTNQTITNIPVNTRLIISFSHDIDPLSASEGIKLTCNDQTAVPCNFTFSDQNRTIILEPKSDLEHYTTYRLVIPATVTGLNGEQFPGREYRFRTIAGALAITSATVNTVDFMLPNRPVNIDYKNTEIRITFSDSLNPADFAGYFSIFPPVEMIKSLSPDQKVVTLTSTSQLLDLKRYYFSVTAGLKALNGGSFNGFYNSFYTILDSVPKFPVISDDQLLNLIQEKCFSYFYQHAHPACGLSRERDNSGDLVTSGGSGFGVMALIVGMERGFITRDQGMTRLSKILGFLESCDRYHGVWPHWINGNTGKIIPFSTNDNGADLVETSYMVQGLIAMRQYLNSANPEELTLINRINALNNAVEYDWFTRGQNVLYWHWSPDKGWIMNMQVRGYNETLITYITAATSTTHPIAAEVYHQGYARNGGIKNGNTYYGFRLPLGEAYGGPLFFVHYSFLGLDPRQLSDQYASYWEQNVNQSKINHAYCTANPGKHVGYSSHCWGLTASDNPWGYGAHSPNNDRGVISPTAAVSSLPYTPEESMNAIRFFYYQLGDRLWGEYGFYDAFCPDESWYASSTLAIDQGPMICMIENHRSGLLWELFMSAPEVKAALTKLGFSYPNQIH